MLCFNQLTKRYGRFTALDHFQAELDCGIYALLGPNGAGKSTLMNILVGLISATEGSITYNSQDIGLMGVDFRAILGYMPQYPGFYPGFTAAEFMLYMAQMKGIRKKQAKERCNALLETVNLYPDRDKKISAFSGGMKQRLGLAQALINNPKILILDEPTAGLDPKERIRFRNMVRRLSERMTVIFCTHIVSDIETIAREVLLMNHGKLINKATIPDLVSTMQNKVWEVNAEGDELETLLDKNSRSSLVSRDMETVIRIVSDTCPHPRAALCVPSLEDVYLYQFGEQTR